MTLVMLPDDVPGLGVFRGVAAERFRAGFSPLSDEGLEFTARIGSTLAERPAVLALYPSWRPDAAGRLLRFARASLGTRRLAIVPLDLPPLALSLVAHQLAFLAPYVEPGTLATVAPRLAGLLVAGAREYDASRPVQVVGLWFGPGVDLGALQRIAQATGGAAYQIQDPRQIHQLFQRSAALKICDDPRQRPVG
ncbi:hypothetical protein ACQPZ8_08745 [Actinomadura nitritigenes]|uniref:hypothetical protein n=1 Tax=Actinomadura nitritigenes TaxID=134602 RepID=UPI003D8CC5D9